MLVKIASLSLSVETDLQFGYGLRIWIAYMDCVYGLRIWIAYMDCVYGLRIWIAYMDCVYGLLLKLCNKIKKKSPPQSICKKLASYGGGMWSPKIVRCPIELKRSLGDQRALQHITMILLA